ncbi:MAG: phosphoribosylanthranilate isomerase [Armatimonadota bacterium]
MVRVKICGITCIEDALAAVEAGADALGFVFAESPRMVEAGVVKAIIKALPPFVTTVGVFADQTAEEILATMAASEVQIAQVHGEFEKLPLGKGLGCCRLVRAIRVRSAEDIETARAECPGCGCAGYLLDAHVEGMMGGTGRTFDWSLAVQAKSLGRPIILAGGLSPANVAEAVRTVRPDAVDVSTGVEAAPGKKDAAKMKEFIRNAKGA